MKAIAAGVALLALLTMSCAPSAEKRAADAREAEQERQQEAREEAEEQQDGGKPETHFWRGIANVAGAALQGAGRVVQDANPYDAGAD
jgi:hypothetical protein